MRGAHGERRHAAACRRRRRRAHFRPAQTDHVRRCPRGRPLHQHLVDAGDRRRLWRHTAPLRRPRCRRACGRRCAARVGRRERGSAARGTAGGGAVAMASERRRPSSRARPARRPPSSASSRAAVGARSRRPRRRLAATSLEGPARKAVRRRRAGVVTPGLDQHARHRRRHRPNAEALPRLPWVPPDRWASRGLARSRTHARRLRGGGVGAGGAVVGGAPLLRTLRLHPRLRGLHRRSGGWDVVVLPALGAAACVGARRRRRRAQCSQRPACRPTRRGAGGSSVRERLPAALVPCGSGAGGDREGAEYPHRSLRLPVAPTAPGAAARRRRAAEDRRRRARR